MAISTARVTFPGADANRRPVAARRLQFPTTARVAAVGLVRRPSSGRTAAGEMRRLLPFAGPRPNRWSRPEADAPLPYSITSSARARNDWGIISPSVLAVLRVDDQLEF